MDDLESYTLSDTLLLLITPVIPGVSLSFRSYLSIPMEAQVVSAFLSSSMPTHKMDARRIASRRVAGGD